MADGPNEATETSATILHNDEGAASAVIVDIPSDDQGGNNGDDNNADVAIAEIEANRDITIAAIHADTEQTAIEARANSENERDNDRWQEMETRLTNLQELVTTLSSSIQQLSPPQIVTAETVIVEAPEAETISTPQSTPGETSSTPMEAIDVSAVESPVEPPAPPRKRLRLI